MIRRNTGFTLVELLITMAIIAFVLAGASQMFVGLLSAFKQQGKMAETNIEGIIGLEMLRQDIDSGGYGLPWIIPSGAAPYVEAVAATVYNDSSNNPPRAFLSGNNIGPFGSDELIIKAVNIARNDTCKKWTHLRAGNVLNSWIPSSEDLSPTDQVIVISPGVTNATRRTLVVNGSSWKTTRNNTVGYAPDASENRFVYGVADATVPSIRMPFNRADYYISPSYVPQRCAPNTGTLVKSMISQSDGSRSDQMPLLDCVADMQVVFLLDTNGDGLVDNYSQDISAGLTAQQIRDQLKEVRVFILAHEGQKDSNYIHSQQNIPLGDGTVGTLSSVDVSTRRNYRWKVYTLSVRPHNLR